MAVLLGAWSSLSQGTRDRSLGILFIFLVAVTWVLASFLVQEVEAEGLSPFALTYIANSLFIIYLPVYFVTQKLKQHRKVMVR